jgi:hypothetical protein
LTSSITRVGPQSSKCVQGGESLFRLKLPLFNARNSPGLKKWSNWRLFRVPASPCWEGFCRNTARDRGGLPNAPSVSLIPAFAYPLFDRSQRATAWRLRRSHEAARSIHTAEAHTPSRSRRKVLIGGNRSNLRRLARLRPPNLPKARARRSRAQGLSFISSIHNEPHPQLLGKF